MNDDDVSKLLPKVLVKKGNKNVEIPFNIHKIYNVLLRETHISEEMAKQLTKDTIGFLLNIKLSLITPRLIRDVVNAFKLKYGLELERLEDTIIGISRYELNKIYNDCPDIEERKQKIYDLIDYEKNSVDSIIEERFNVE